MPTIPQYQRRVGAQGELGPGPTASLASQVAPALTELGATVDRSNYQRRVVAAQDSLSTLRMKAAQQFQQAQNEAAPGGKDFTPNVLKGFDGLVTETTQTLDPVVRKMVQQESKQIRENLFNSALNFEARTGVANRSSQFDASTDKLAVAVGIDPAQFNDAVASQSAILAELDLPPEVRAAHAQRLQDTLTQAAAAGLAKQDPEGVLAALSTAKSGDARFDGLSAQARAQVQKVATAHLVQQSADAITGIYESQGPKAGAELLANLSKSGLPPDLQGEVRAQVLSQLSGIRTVRRQERAQDLVKVERSIGDRTAGQATRVLVDDLYESGALTEDQYAGYYAQIDAAGRERTKDAEAQAALTAALSSGLPLDPTDAKHRDALERSFAVDTSAAPVGTEMWQSIALGYASKTRMLPPQAIQWTRQAIRSPDPQLQATAAQFYADAETTAPESLVGFDTQTKAYAGLVSSMIAAGTPDVRAAEAANEATYKASPQVREFRREQYKALAKGTNSTLSDLIDRDFDPGWFSSAPAATQALAADYGMQEARYYEITGDIERSREMAWKDVKRVYGPTRVNGEPQLMMMPPERFGVTPEAVRKDIGAWLAQNPQADGTTAEDVNLVPDASTQRNAFSMYDGSPVRPSYKAIGKSGEILVGSDGLPVRYTLPGEADVMRDRAVENQEVARDQIEDARLKRRMENTTDMRLLGN